MPKINGDCFQNNKFNSSCRLYPITFPFDINEVEGDGLRNIRLFFAIQSANVSYYISVFIGIYFLAFIAFLVITLTRKPSLSIRRRKKYSKRKKARTTIVSSDINGDVHTIIVSRSNNPFAVQNV